ncbi:MAG: HAMP domain-containing sensor histidine kinase [Candidatus Nealsonbacteria bacterium]
MIKKIFNKLNVVGHCKNQGVPVWQCPQFLFLIMGTVIIFISVGSFLIGNRYIIDPSIVALIDIIITMVLLIISFFITKSFERLSEVSQMKSEFINIVSHQLRSPITNIKWIIDFLVSKDIKMSPEKEEEYFNHLKENVSRMVELVDELLIISRIEKGSLPIKKVEFSLEDLVKELIFNSKAYSQALNLKVKFYPQRDLPKVYFDPVLIKLVVENLIDNAIRYTKPKGKVEIWIEKKGSYLLFKIKDTGVGIPKKDQKYIFQKFFRSNNSLKEKIRGSGLGLYIAKLIIEKSKGKIWFKSKQDKGTAFHFLLPIK